MPRKTPKPAKSREPAKPVGRGRSRKAWIIASLVVLLVLLYVVAPFVILKFLNRSLNKNPQYQNHVGGLVLHPLRGGYALHDFAIRRKLGDTVVSVFTAKTIDVSLQWRSLLRGAPRAKASLREPRLNLVAQFLDAKPPKKPVAWQRTFDLFHVAPVDQITVREGAIHFLDFSKGPPVDVHLKGLEGSVNGLTAARGKDSGSALPSSLKARARLMDQAEMRIDAKMLPAASDPTLDLRARLEPFKLAALNGAFRAYARLDVERGEISVSARIRAQDGRFEGIVHREAKGFKIFASGKDNEGFLRSAWEAVTDAAAQLVEKRAEPGQTPDVPVSGSFAPQAETWSAIGGLLRGTFVRALDPRLGKSLGEDAGIRWDTPEVSKAKKVLPP